MIKELFLPERTKSKRLISKRIIGVSIEEERVSAAQVYATSSSTNIEKIKDQPIAPGAPGSRMQRIAQAITSLLPSFSSYDQIIISIPSSVVTFKELTLPFVDAEKIKMVVEYEVEPQLPFSVNDAIIDFIITHKNFEEQKSQVLVAAVRKQDLKEIVDMYQQIEVDPEAITVDLFALYGLFLQIPEYKQISHASALIDIGTTSTSVAFLMNGEMRLIRNIAKGLHTIANHISENTGRPTKEVLKRLEESGVLSTDDVSFNQAVQKQITNYLNDIQFTLNSFSLKLNFYEEISKILFVGEGMIIKGLMDFCSTVLQIPCEHFSCNKLFKTKLFKNKTKKVATSWTDHAIDLGTAIIYPEHSQFDLRKKEFIRTHFPVLNKQLITAVFLAIALFVTIGTRGQLQVKKLTSITKQREKKAIKKLKKLFPPGSKSLKKNKLTPLIKDATREISIRQEAWTPFLRENLQPLQILQDLTQTIDRRSFDVKIEKIRLDVDSQGSPVGEVLGVFKSRLGMGEHFTDYAKFVAYFRQQSNLMTIEEEDADEVEDGEGVKFTFKLKAKVQKQI
jgi:type IV pilus assembly protein PilM